MLHTLKLLVQAVHMYVCQPFCGNCSQILEDMIFILRILLVHFSLQESSCWLRESGIFFFFFWV